MTIANKANRGRSLERIILASQRDIVRLVQVSGTVRRLRGGAMIQTRGPVDFSGVVCGDGRAVFLDAKSSNQTRLVTDESHLPEHQRQELLRLGEGGAIAGLLCESVKRRRYYWCDWRMLETRRPSIPWDELRDIGDAALVIDFKKVVTQERQGA